MSRHRQFLAAVVAPLVMVVAGGEQVRAQKVSAPKTRPPVFTVEDLDDVTRKAMVGVTWQPGCPVALVDLRRVVVPYVDFDGAEQTGAIVVNHDVAEEVGRVFVKLHAARFPFAKIMPIEAFGGDDDRSTIANNTSAFNCRTSFGIDGLPTKRWSQHAYGRAVDVNPVQNPYVLANGTVGDPNAKAFVDRTIGEPGMATGAGVLVRAFAVAGWKWGGNWRAAKDYQHFSVNGR